MVGGDGHVLRRPVRAAPRRVCSAEAAAQVVDILADPEARAPAFGLWSVLRLPFPAAVKTGTSEGFRDNWCVGGTREVVVGVWAGNFDRSPMGNVSGVTGAGAVWREVMLAWAEVAHPGSDLATRDTLGPLPPGLRRVDVCALSGLAPSPACPRVIGELAAPRAGAPAHLHLARSAWRTGESSCAGPASTATGRPARACWRPETTRGDRGLASRG